MLRNTTIEEKELITKKVEELLKGVTSVDFTGTTISPYNLLMELPDHGFITKNYDQRGDDTWFNFSHDTLGNVTMHCDACLFELTLEIGIKQIIGGAENEQ